jgi:hypothetical protein
MALKRSSSKPRRTTADLSKDLWISPYQTLRGRDGDRAWDNSRNLSPRAGARLLEVADIALGNKKLAPRKNKAAPRTCS